MQGVLAVWNDVDESVFSEYEAWYLEEHLPERLYIPGFRTGVRSESVAIGGVFASPRFFTYYELDSAGVLDNPDYRFALESPSARTRSIMPYFRGMWRAVATLQYQGGLACSAAWVVTVRCPRRLLHFWSDRLRLTPPPGACRWRLYDCEPNGAAPSPEVRFRNQPDQTPGCFLLVEYARRSDAQAGLQDWSAAASGAPDHADHDDDACRVDIFSELVRLDHRDLV